MSINYDNISYKVSLEGTLVFSLTWVQRENFLTETACDCRYMFGLPSDSMGLLMLLDKGPDVRSWRYVHSTQVGD